MATPEPFQRAPQPLTDLIPKSQGIYWAVIFLNVALMALLCFGYMRIPDWTEALGTERLTPLDLDDGGSFFAWWMALLWLLGAALAWFVFRRSLQEEEAENRQRPAGSHASGSKPLPTWSFGHLADIWLWGALGCLVLSVDATVRFRLLFRDLLMEHGGARFNGGGDFWWIGLYVLIFFGLIGTRLILELRKYLPACIFFLASVLLFAASAALLLGVLDGNDRFKPTEIVMLRCATEMPATLLLLIALSVYARNLVLRDPEVLLRWFGKGEFVAVKEPERSSKTGEIPQKTVVVLEGQDSGARETLTIKPARSQSRDGFSGREPVIRVDTGRMARENEDDALFDLLDSPAIVPTPKKGGTATLGTGSIDAEEMARKRRARRDF